MMDAKHLLQGSENKEEDFQEKAKQGLSNKTDATRSDLHDQDTVRWTPSLQKRRRKKAGAPQHTDATS